jgi:hypothetical protein
MESVVPYVFSHVAEADHRGIASLVYYERGEFDYDQERVEATDNGWYLKCSTQQDILRVAAKCPSILNADLCTVPVKTVLCKLHFNSLFFNFILLRLTSLAYRSLESFWF